VGVGDNRIGKILSIEDASDFGATRETRAVVNSSLSASRSS
jgi:hypothetical protein